MPGFKTIAVAALNGSRKQAAKRIANGFLGECYAAAALGKFKATAEVTIKYDATILPAMAEHDNVKDAVIREIIARVDDDVRGLSIDIEYNHENKEIPEELKATLSVQDCAVLTSPEWAPKLSLIAQLDLRNCGLSTLPASIGGAHTRSPQA